VKININKIESCLDDNKQVSIEDENCYICSIKNKSEFVSTTIEDNVATISDEDLECGDTVDVWYYSLL